MLEVQGSSFREVYRVSRAPHRPFSSVQFNSIQSLSHVQLFATPWIAVCQASLSITNSQSLHELMSIELVMPSNHLIILCRPLLQTKALTRRTFVSKVMSLLFNMLSRLGYILYNFNCMILEKAKQWIVK